MTDETIKHVNLISSNYLEIYVSNRFSKRLYIPLHTSLSILMLKKKKKLEHFETSHNILF